MSIICASCQTEQPASVPDAPAPANCVKCGAVLGVSTVAEAPALSAVAAPAAGPRAADQERTTPDGHDARAPSVADSATVAPGALSTPGLDTEVQAGSRTMDAPVHAFLAPAQGPDEIGRLGPYRVLSVLGQGGMGVVFLAQDTRLGRQVAIKAMLPQLAIKADARERFLREARTAASIEHDHIVAILQVDEDRGVPYIAMPFLRGTTLEAWLREHRDEMLPVPLILKIGKQIAHGLAAAHAAGLIHRDIKPANIFLQSTAIDPTGRNALLPTSPLTCDFRAKILDFGLARSSSPDQNLTQTGTILGTPAYMAPEQARRGVKVTHRTDLFSLGVVLYRLSTGQLPFQGDDMMSTLLATAMEEPKPPRELNPQLPTSLAGLVLRLLSKDPERRPVNAEEVVERLEAIENWLADGTRLPPPLEVAPRPTSVAPAVPTVLAAPDEPPTAPLYRAVPLAVSHADEDEPVRVRRRDGRQRRERDDVDISLPARPPSGLLSITSLVLGLLSFLTTVSSTVVGLSLSMNCACAVLGGYFGLAVGGVLALGAIGCGIGGLRQGGGRPYARAGLISAAISLTLIVVDVILMISLGPNLFAGGNRVVRPQPQMNFAPVQQQGKQKMGGMPPPPVAKDAPPKGE